MQPAKNTSEVQSNVVQMAWPAPNLRSLMEADAQYLDNLDRAGKRAFVERQGGMFYYERDLLGIPFVFATTPQWGRVKDQFGERDVCRIGIRLVSLARPGGALSEPQIAQFSHRYLMADIRSLTENELRTHLWTLGRDETMPLTPRGEYPVRLKVYEHGIDTPEQIESEPADGFTPATPPQISEAEMNSARARFGLTSATPDERGAGPRAQAPTPQPQVNDAQPPKRGRGRPRIHFPENE